ncbi:MAG: DUF2332 family protein [Hyphomicrobiales bacterium]|nr:DUF2332 family protein [Hyphomicrobiales bacterium]MCP5373654.1 DUF2332 family protein [Hyphomicrobiales bacterium]
MSSLTDDRAPAVRDHFRGQARACRGLGSSFTADLLDLCADNLDPAGAVGGAVLGWAGSASHDALALRLAGGLHALVIDGRDRALAAAYGAGAVDWPTVARALADHAGFLLGFLARPPQTNEVARAGVLAGGFLTVAAEAGRPLSLLEIGAAAGLNLNWAAFSYDLGGLRWGDPDSPLHLAPQWTGPPPPDARALVAARAGCDRDPVDPLDPADRLRLRAYIWPDQPDRRRRMDAALAIMARDPVRVDKAAAADWLAARLGRQKADTVPVLFHSIMWQYVDPVEQDRIRALVAAVRQPLAWLRMEPSPDLAHAELHLTLGPGGADRLLARADFHGRWVEWVGE